jgi:hypothetical protein
MTTRGKIGTMDRRTGVVFDHALFDIGTNRYLRPHDAAHLRHVQRQARRSKPKVARDAAPVDMAAHVKGWNRLP